MKYYEVDMLTEEAAKQYLRGLIIKLDELSNEDFFGTEGWRHFLLGED